MDILEKITGFLTKILLSIGGVAIISMAVHICIDVFAKAVFNRPLIGTLEIVSWYYMLSCLYLPVAYVQLKKGHLMVELFTMGLKDRTVRIWDGVVGLIGCVYVGVLTWLTLIEAIDSTIQGEIVDITFMDFPVWPIRWALPLAFGLMTLILALQSIRNFQNGSSSGLTAGTMNDATSPDTSGH